jgi:hypothetical protein
LAHKVICKYCEIPFDRDKEPYVPAGSRRYAHVKCYQKENPDANVEIVFPDEFVTCKYCKKKINKTRNK